MILVSRVRVLTMMFWGLMSRWMILREWRWRRPEAICLRMRCLLEEVKG